MLEFVGLSLLETNQSGRVESLCLCAPSVANVEFDSNAARTFATLCRLLTHTSLNHSPSAVDMYRPGLQSMVDESNESKIRHTVSEIRCTV
jgi:hypothetical protein